MLIFKIMSFGLLAFATTACNSSTPSPAAEIADNEKNQTAKFRVWGNCGMCQKTIETAAKIKGVAHAAWNMDTDSLTVRFDPKVVKIEDIQQQIALAGYDNDAFRGDNKAYTALPECCQYERKP